MSVSVCECDGEDKKEIGHICFIGKGLAVSERVHDRGSKQAKSDNNGMGPRCQWRECEEAQRFSNVAVYEKNDDDW